MTRNMALSGLAVGELGSPVPYLSGIRRTAAPATWQPRLLQVVHHLIEEPTGLPRVVGSCNLGSEDLDNSAGFGETVGPRGQATLRGGQANHGPHQIVGGHAHFYFFGGHVWRGAGELIQAQLTFERAQIGFDFPALSVELEQVPAGRGQSGKQNQQKGWGTVVRLYLAREQTAAYAGVCGQLRMTSAILSAGCPHYPAIHPAWEGAPGQALGARSGQAQQNWMSCLCGCVGHRKHTKVAVPHHRR